MNLIKEGNHPAVARGHRWGVARTKTKQIAVQCEIVGGPDKGRHIVWYGPWTDKTWKRTMQSLRYMGWKGDDLGNLGALNQKFTIVVEHEKFDEEWSAKVKWVNGFGSSGIQLSNPMSDADIAAFAAKMRKRAQGIAEVAGEVVTATDAHEESPAGESLDPWDDAPPPPDEPSWGSPSNDDIPF